MSKEKDERLKRLYASKAVTDLLDKNVQMKMLRDVASEIEKLGENPSDEAIQEFLTTEIDIESLQAAFSSVNSFINDLDVFLKKQKQEKEKEVVEEKEEEKKEEVVVPIPESVAVASPSSSEFMVSGPQFIDKSVCSCNCECPSCGKKVEQEKEKDPEPQPVGNNFENDFEFELVDSDDDSDLEKGEKKKKKKKEKKVKKEKEEKEKKHRVRKFFRGIGSNALLVLRPRDKSRDEHRYVHIRPWVPLVPQAI